MICSYRRSRANEAAHTQLPVQKTRAPAARRALTSGRVARCLACRRARTESNAVKIDVIDRIGAQARASRARSSAGPTCESGWSASATRARRTQGIIAAHLEFLDDPALNETAQQLICGGQERRLRLGAMTLGVHRRAGALDDSVARARR